MKKLLLHTKVKSTLFSKLAILLAFVFMGVLGYGQTTNTWKGGTSGTWSNTANWSRGSVPSATDVVTFDGNAINGTSGNTGSVSITSVPTTTIGRLVLLNSANFSLQPVAATAVVLSVGNATAHSNGVDDISVPSGNTLTLATNGDGLTTTNITLGLANVSGVTSNIAGTLTLMPNATTTAAALSATAWSSGQTYSLNQFITNNNFLYKVTTVGTGTAGATAPTGNFNNTVSASTSGSYIYTYQGTMTNFGGNSTNYAISTTNAYSIQFGATTFSGTLNLGGALSNVSTGGTISFTSAATIVLFNNTQQFPQNSSNITYTSVNAQVNNYVSTSGAYVINYLPNSVGTLTVNDGSITGGSLVFISVFQKASSYTTSTSQTATINNLKVQAGIVGFGRNSTSSTNNISTLSIGSGGINVSGGTLALAYGQAASASSTITVTGPVNLTTGTLNIFSGGTNAQTATMTVNSLSQGSGTLNLNTITSGTASTGTLNVLGDFSCTGGTITQTAQNANNIANLVMKGTTGNQTFTTGGTITKVNIQINNTSTAPNNTVTLGSNYTMTNGASTSCTLQLTAGVLTLSTYTLQIANVTGGIVGSTASGGATLGLSAAYGTGNYIDASGTGVFKISGVPATATTFPLGATFSGTNYYLPLVFTSVANSPTVSVGCATAFAYSVSDATKVVKAQWSIQSSGASGTPSVTFQFTGTTSDILGSAYVTSGSVLGIYANSAYSETAATVTNTSGTYTTPVSLTLPTGAPSLYGVGNTGAFSTAASITLGAISKYSTDADFTLTPTSANTLGAYTFSSNTTSVATVNSTSGLVHIVGPGTTTITVNQAANGSFAAGTTTAVITVVGAYTWNGTTSDYQVSTNWTPTRTAPANSDVLQFGTISVPSAGTTTYTVTNIPTQIIGRLVLSSNAQVSLQETSGASAILTVGNTTTHAMAAGDEISIPSGCALTLAQNASGGSEIFTLQLISSVSGVTSNISGTLTIAQNTTSTYANVYNAVNGVTTIYGTGVINYAGTFNSSTATSLIFKNGSTINNQRADATFSGASGTTSSDRVNVSFSGSNCGTSGTGQIPINNLPAYIGTLTVNATGATGTMNVRGISGGSGTSQTVDITTLTVSSTGTGSFGFGSNTTAVSTVNVGTGGITVNGGKLNLAYNIGQTITVNGDMSISNSSTVSLCSSGSNTTYTGSLTVNNFTQTGSSTFKLNANGGSATLQSNFPTSILTVKGNFSVAAASTFFNQISASPNSIVMNGSTPQTFTASGTFTNVDAMQLEINNTATNTITLSSAMPTIGTLKLTKGTLVLGSNSLTTGAVSGGSSTAYVNASSTGRLTILAVPTSATTFPIGTAASYAPVTFTGGTAGADISMGVKSTFTHTPNVANNVVNLEWAMLATISTTPTVKLQYNASTDQASGYSSTGAILGTYEAGSYSESTSAFTIDATTPTATTATIAFTNDLPTSTEDYYGIGNPNSFAVSGLPTKPTIGTASISGSSVSVSFTPPVDAVATGVTGYLVTSSPGGITATGTSSPISISGLGGGTSYTFTVKSVNAFGNSPASTASNSVTTPVYTYTWTGTTSTNYQTATNWSPNRTTPTTTDKLQFSSNATVINVPTQTIGRLALSNNASVSLQETSGTSATLSVGNTTAHINGVDDINVPAGCTLTMAANASGGTEFLTIQLASAVTGVTANIAGTLTIAQNASGTYSNTYNAANGVTTISGTVNYAGGFSNISSTSLLFTSNSTINNQRGDATFPPAFSGTYTRVNVSITGATSTVQVPVSNFPASVNTLTVNDAGITGSGVLLIRSIAGGGSGTAQVADITNLTVTNGIVGFGLNATAIATVTVGSGGINVSGGKLLLAYNSAQTITAAGSGINLSSTGIISMCSSGGSAFAATLTTTNFTQTGASTFYVNGYFGSAPLPTATMNVTGNFSVGSTSLFSQATGVTGTLVFNSTNAAQTISNAGTISNISTVQINNTAVSPNNTVTLNTALTIPNALTLTSGTLVLGSNNLTVKGTLTNNATLSGGTGIVTLNNGTAQTIAGTGGTISNLTLSTSGTVATITGSQNITGILKVSTGTILNTGGSLTLKSTSITNSAVVDKVDGTISGNVTVERYIPKGFRAYRDIAPAVYGAGTIFKNWQLNGASTPGYGIFITGPTAYSSSSNAGTTDASGFDRSGTSTYNTQDYTFLNGAWTALANTNATNLDPFTGYRLLVRGDRTSNIYTTPVINTQAGLTMYNATTLSATGQLVTGTVTYNTVLNGGVTNTATGGNTSVGLNATSNGFSLVANPYVAPVQWGTGTGSNSSTTTVYGASSNINGSYWYLDPTSNATGKYIAFNALTGASTVGGSGTYSNTGTVPVSTGYIQPGQAVFVQTTGASPTVVFQETAKAVSSAKVAVFGAVQLSKIYLSLMKQSATTKTFDMVDGSSIAFRPDFGNKAYGPQDAIKFSGASDNLAISDKGKSLSIDGRLPATASDAIPLAITKPSATAYQLSVDASNYSSNGFEPMLYDAFKNTTKALGAGTTTINFTVDANNAASFSNRFIILFTPSALPVNSIVASASLNNKVATISWKTAGENNVVRYEVEKSADAKLFTTIGQSTAKNTATASYTTTDNSVTATTYYRIKAVSTTGAISYSNVVKLSTDNRLPSYSLYPNPLKGGNIVTVGLGNVVAGKYTVSIYNALGQRVSEQTISHTGGSATHAISINNALAAGAYSVTISEAGSKQIIHQTSITVQP